MSLSFFLHLSLREAKLAKRSILFAVLSVFALALLICTLFAVAWIDLQNLLAMKAQNTGWYGLLPFVTCGLALAMVWNVKPFRFYTISFILLVSLVLHLAAQNYYAVQPIAQFPTIDYLERIAPKPVQRKNIAEDFKKEFSVVDSASVTRGYIDTLRSNVVILVESWGVPLDLNRFKMQLRPFNEIATKIGVHNRMYSRTRTAEREDLIYDIRRDSLRKDTSFLPSIFANRGYKTLFLFGGDSLEQFRYKYINNIGFSESIYGNGYEDRLMALKIDSLLADTLQNSFIAWTTRDTKFPMNEFRDIYNSDANAVDSVYALHLEHTLSLIATLAHRHPNVRFVVQGDHNPILSPLEFQDRFYKRWVPFIVLN